MVLAIMPQLKVGGHRHFHEMPAGAGFNAA